MEISEALTTMIVLPIFFGFCGWIIKLVFDWKKMRLKSEFHHKLVDKFGDVKELNNFLQTEGGINLIQPITINGSLAPKEKLMLSISKGIIFICLGIAAFILGLMFEESSRYLYGCGVIIIALGIGFLASSSVSYNLTKKWGIIEEK